MAKRYTYSRTFNHNGEVETFTAAEFDSFDEAIKAVDKGIYDRELSLGKKPGKRDNKEDANTSTGAPSSNVPLTTGGQ